MPKERISARLKRELVDRASNCCEYCRSQAEYATQPFSVEHIVPQQRGGTSAIDNLALACQGCNNYKYTKIQGTDPVSQEDVALFHPRRQRWRDHFAWSDDLTFVVGLTPIGRATVEALKLNRQSLVNLRRVLYVMGEHPPKEPD